MKTRLMAMMAGLGLLVGLSGCLEVNQTVTVKKDGSGTISDETVMGAQMIAMMSGFGGGAPGGAGPLAKMHDEAQYKARAAQYGEGVEYVKLTITTPDPPEGIEKPDLPEGAGGGIPPGRRKCLPGCGCRRRS